MFSSFSLEVVMDGYTENSSRRNTPSTLIATATSIKISREQIDSYDSRSQQFICVLVPHSTVESSLRRTIYDRKFSQNSNTARNNKDPTKDSKCVWLEQADRIRLSRDLLPRIHHVFASNSSSSKNTTANNTSSTSNAASTATSMFSSIFQYQSQPSPPQTSNHQPIMIRAVFSTTSMTQQSPADVVLLDLPHVPQQQRRTAGSSTSTSTTSGDAPVFDPAELLHATNGDGMAENPNFILKLLLISQVHIASSPMNLLASSASLEIPTCPVCLHRIDPVRLGLPKPLAAHLCSKFCPSSIDTAPVAAAASAGASTTLTATDCPKQRFLIPWPEPSRCIACQVVHDYQTVGVATNFMSTVYCNRCALQKTLWVCLTNGCGFVGCGRYSNKHAEAHFLESGHNYSLELATLRIWEYVHGEFAHRVDLLECPSGRQQRARALQLQQQIEVSLHDSAAGSSGGGGVASAAGVAGGFVSSALMAAAVAGDMSPPMATAAMGGAASLDKSCGERWAHQQPYFWHDPGGDEKSPKKAIMIGEEYEALLQSALEDQAQHFQGELSRLRAALTAEQVDLKTLSSEEAEMIEKLKSEIRHLRGETELIGRELLEVQAQEAGLRADSQRLLREQQVAQDLLKTIYEQTTREHEQGKRQMEELEQQIEDLTANLRMRHQFSQDQELNNAQIFGTLSSPDQGKASSNRKGKLRRLFRK